MLFLKNWFEKEKIVNYFPIVASSIFIGNGLGCLFPFLFIDENETDKELISMQYHNMILVMIIIVSISLFLS